MIIVVGSTNKTKIEPVRDVFKKHFKNVKVVGVKVFSGVSDQPKNEDEMYKGALNRAKGALVKVKNAQYGVGIEGGIHKRSYGWFEHSLVVIVDKKGNIGVGASGGLALPKVVIDRIMDGKNLEQAVDEIFGTEKIGEGIGMFGVFTKGYVTRSSGVSHGVAFALARFLHGKVYDQ
ncbi:inosine/xanthosine triphosphatase [Candidatus Gottesmanbacteria bacterium]|nr:inosine/xanthosine triphosphatase [Candidatus Gottesmanbacteria bacterium]